jgi:rhodanese-related sulfurtransferase
LARTIDELLAAARAGLRRLEPAAALTAVRDGALLVDIRPLEERRREGDVPGAVVIGRNVLEWRLDPASARHVPEARPAPVVVVLCREGFQSSLAAATLQHLGLRATDVVGGFEAWRAAGLPVVDCCGPTAEEAGEAS